MGKLLKHVNIINLYNLFLIYSAYKNGLLNCIIFPLIYLSTYLIF